MATRSERAAIKAKKEKNHDRYVVRVYGLEPGEYDLRLAAQGGGCAICRKKPRNRFLAVDHDHRTGAVRGLLCYMCNTALGIFEFDRSTAQAASLYLQDIARSWVEVESLIKQDIATVPTHDDLPF